MKKKRKIKKIRIDRILFLIIFVFIIIMIFKNRKIKIVNIELKDNNFIVELNKKDIECILSNDSPTLSDKWIKSDKKICTLEYKEGIYNLYIKENDEITNLTKKDIYYLNTSKLNDIYIASNDKKQYIYALIGNIEKLKIENTNENIAILNEKGYIETKDKGNTTIKYTYKDKEHKINVSSTNLIVHKPEEYDFDKEFLECNAFSEEEGKKLDNILENNIKEAGYKTRAGVVEAARFLTLDFPYKIEYFYENGRQTTNNIDGEGRYYHKGLYLNESKFDEIINSKTKPSIWGCSLYSYPIESYSNNGLDCSGFVSWALLNGGFDVKDVGAGFRDGELNDLTDFGDLKKLKLSVLNNNTIKPGDLLHSEHGGGHIAIIIGIKDDNYYVAQALWKTASSTLTNTDIKEGSVQITKYTKNELVRAYNEIILMDKYYKEDGKLTDMWY